MKKIVISIISVLTIVSICIVVFLLFFSNPTSIKGEEKDIDFGNPIQKSYNYIWKEQNYKDWIQVQAYWQDNRDGSYKVVIKVIRFGDVLDKNYYKGTIDGSQFGNVTFKQENCDY